MIMITPLPRIFFDGWHADALPWGPFSVLIGSQYFETDQRVVPLPPVERMPPSKPENVRFPPNVLWHRMAPDGVRFAGIGHRDDHCWEWTGNEWVRHGLAFGPRSVIYDAFGELRVIDQAPATGFRNVTPDGRIISAEATYADPVRRIWEYTDLPSLTVGQGGQGLDGEDPLIALFANPASRHLISKGQCRRINAHQDENTVALAWVREDAGFAAILWLDVEVIRALPPPTLPPPAEDRMNKPEVTVDAFNFTKDNHMSDGEKLVFHDRENVHGARVRVWVEGGSMRMSIEYPGVGVGQTGARRDVR